MSSSTAADIGGGGGGVAARVIIICSVCTEPLMKDGSVQVSTPCGHVYHKHCLINWYTSSKQYCCPYCNATTESDSNGKFQVFLSTEEDSDYLAIHETVAQLRQEKNEIMERLSQEKANALERLRQEQMEAVDRLQLEHSGKMEQLRKEHAEQIRQLQQEQEDILHQETKAMERTIQRLKQENAQTLVQLRQEQIVTVYGLLEKSGRLQKLEHAKQIHRLRVEHSNEKGKFHRLIQSQKNEIQLLTDEIQLLKDEIRNLKKPMDLLQKRVKTLASEKLQREVDALMEKLKPLDEAGGSNSGGGECGASAPGGVAAAQGRSLPSAKTSTGRLSSVRIEVPAFKSGSEVQRTSSSTTSSVGTKVTKIKIKRPEIILEKLKPINVRRAISIRPPQLQSSSEKRGASAAQVSGVASKKQKVHHNTNNCRPKPTVQRDMTKQTNELVFFKEKRLPNGMTQLVVMEKNKVTDEKNFPRKKFIAASSLNVPAH